MINLSKSKISTYTLITVIFIVLSYMYYSPVLEGKKLITNDTSVWKASAKEIFEHREKYGEEPLWTNSMFSGMPSYQISASYKGNLVKPVQKLLQIFKIPVSALFLTLLGFFILLLVFDLKPWLAATGAIAYAFGSYNFIILAAGHNTKAYAIAYMAPMIAGIILSFRKNRLAGAALAGLFLALEIAANHLQITYYTLLILIVFGISELWFTIKESKLLNLSKSLGLLAAIALFAVGANFAPLYTTMEYTDYTMRGGSNLSTSELSAQTGLDKEYATRWSLGTGETLTLLIPNIRGGASEGLDRDSETFSLLQKYQATQLLPYFHGYWGKQPGTSPVYAGAIVIFLFFMGLFLVDKRDRWWLIAATVISIMLAWGKNFMGLTSLFFDYFPGYNKFRAVSMILVIAGFTIPLLGFLGLRNLFQGKIEPKKFYMAFKWSLGITGGLSLLFALFPAAAGNFSSPNDSALFAQLGLNPEMTSQFESALFTDRKALLQTDAFRSFAFIILAGSSIYFWYIKKLKLNYAIGILALLILLDLWTVDKRFLNNEMFRTQPENAEPYPMTTADREILKDSSPNYRVLNLSVSTFNDASTSNYHKSIGGYHGAKLQRYQELIMNGLSADINRIRSTAQNASSMEQLKAPLPGCNSLNMLNTKYIIINPDGAPLVNEYALGNAWLVKSIRFVNGADEEMSLINSFNPGGEALVDKQFSDLLSNSEFDSQGSIELISYKANELVYNYNSPTKSLAVFSEIYYPLGWEAYIDGVRSDYLRVNYLLRGMELPKGKHEIIFRFDPDSYHTGNNIAFVSSIILLLLIAGFAVLSFKKNRKTA